MYTYNIETGWLAQESGQQRHQKLTLIVENKDGLKQRNIARILIDDEQEAMEAAVCICDCLNAKANGGKV